MRSKAVRPVPVDYVQKILANPTSPITSGIKSPDGYPQSVEHFVVDDYPELLVAYGQRPKALLIMFPSDDIFQFVISEKNKYATTKTGEDVKMRYCDGATCHIKVETSIKGNRYEAGKDYPCVCAANKLFDIEKPKGELVPCSDFFHFTAWIIGPAGNFVNSQPYRFLSHSPNTRNNIFTTLSTVSQLTAPEDEEVIAQDGICNNGRLLGIMFALTVKMVRDGKKRYPIWSLHPVGNKDALLEAANKRMLPIIKANPFSLNAMRALQSGDTQTLPQLSAGENDQSIGNTAAIKQPPIALELPLDDKPQQTVIESSEKRDKLLHTFCDYEALIGSNFISRVRIVLKRNWDGNRNNLSDDDLRACIQRFREINK